MSEFSWPYFQIHTCIFCQNICQFKLFLKLNLFIFLCRSEEKLRVSAAAPVKSSARWRRTRAPSWLSREPAGWARFAAPSWAVWATTSSTTLMYPCWSADTRTTTTRIKRWRCIPPPRQHSDPQDLQTNKKKWRRKTCHYRTFYRVSCSIFSFL